MLLNYHIGRFVLGSLCAGDLVRLGLSSVRVAAFSLQHRPLNILTLSNWLNVKFHYSLIESTVKILNSLFLLAHLRNALPYRN